MRQSNAFPQTLIGPQNKINKTLPPDIVFAQRASALVKAAGMNPKEIDLDTFYRLAPLIFAKTYCAIYKENLLAPIHEYLSREENILNAQLVIDGLYAKTNNQVLLETNGEDIYNGKQRAISIVVKCLFLEGHRLWLEKSERKKDKSKFSEPIDIKMNVQNYNKQQQSDINSPLTVNDSFDDNHSNQNNDNNSENDDYNEEENLKSILKLNLLTSDPNVSPSELNGLLQRISYLESRLKSRKSNKNNRSRRPRPKSAAAPRIENNPYDDENRININRQGKFPAKLRSKSMRGVVDEDHEKENYDSDSDPIQKQKYHNNNEDLDDRLVAMLGSSHEKNRLARQMEELAGIENKLRRKIKRPSSAPSVRRILDVSDRLYSAHLNRAKLPTPPPNDDEKQYRAITPPRRTGGDYSSDLYTYDMRSGRRILLSDAQRIMIEQKRNKEIMGNIMAISDMRPTTTNGNNYGKMSPPPPGPTISEYPGKRTQDSVMAWLQKKNSQTMANDSGSNHPHNNNNPNAKQPSELPNPRQFSAYSKLDNLDLIISIEYCHSCEHHNKSTRHNPDEYAKNSDIFLKVVAQIAHESCVSARVGITRFKASITHKSKLTDEDSRIGAFEIHVAYRNVHGDIIPGIIHSKLTSRKWPSKSVLSKRFQSFISKSRIHTFNRNNNHDNQHEIGHDGLEPYPIGVCNWSDTIVSDDRWTFQLSQMNGLQVQQKQKLGISDQDSQATNHLSKVLWVFDTRKEHQNVPIPNNHNNRNNFHHNYHNYSDNQSITSTIATVKSTPIPAISTIDAPNNSIDGPIILENDNKFVGINNNNNNNGEMRNVDNNIHSIDSNTHTADIAEVLKHNNVNMDDLHDLLISTEHNDMNRGINDDSHLHLFVESHAADTRISTIIEKDLHKDSSLIVPNVNDKHEETGQASYHRIDSKDDPIHAAEHSDERKHNDDTVTNNNGHDENEYKIAESETKETEIIPQKQLDAANIIQAIVNHTPNNDHSSTILSTIQSNCEEVKENVNKVDDTNNNGDGQDVINNDLNEDQRWLNPSSPKASKRISDALADIVTPSPTPIQIKHPNKNHKTVTQDKYPQLSSLKTTILVAIKEPVDESNDSSELSKLEIIELLSVFLMDLSENNQHTLSSNNNNEDCDYLYELSHDVFDEIMIKFNLENIVHNNSNAYKNDIIQTFGEDHPSDYSFGLRINQFIDWLQNDDLMNSMNGNNDITKAMTTSLSLSEALKLTPNPNKLPVMSAESLELQEYEKEKSTLSFIDKDVLLSEIVIEGDILQHSNYDNVQSIIHIQISGNAHEAAALRTSRITQMTAKDLLNYKFDNLHFTFDEDDNIYDDISMSDGGDNNSMIGSVKKKGNGNGRRSRRGSKGEMILRNNLYPKASLSNLLNSNDD
eukprot:gene4554-6426_t